MNPNVRRGLLRRLAVDFVFRDELFGFECGHATHASGGDCLSIDLILYIASRKTPGIAVAVLSGFVRT